MINADKLGDLFTEARKQFQEEKYNNTALVQCEGCKAYVHASAQHWNDVGGQVPGFCEMCWVESIICFWASEDEAAQEAEIGELKVETVEYNNIDRSFDNHHGMGQ
jgi:hypothetical protein